MINNVSCSFECIDMYFVITYKVFIKFLCNNNISDNNQLSCGWENIFHNIAEPLSLIWTYLI